MYTKTALWKHTIGAKEKYKAYEKQINILSTAYVTLRQNVETLAQDIAKALPSFTVHDITHADALWDTASTIVGGNYPLTPIEAFVLGCSFLIHDLGMTPLVYEKGIDSFKDDPKWNDILNLLYFNKYNRFPKNDEIVEKDSDIVVCAIEYYLREHHNEQAKRILNKSWSIRNKTYYLLEDSRLCDYYGELIGNISASHCWDVDSIELTFNYIIAAAPDFPNEWTVDPLKLACILRAADAANVDSRRVPTLYWARKSLNEFSDIHHVFQNFMRKPVVENEQLVFSSNKSFLKENADAWWLAQDTLKMINNELHNIDELLRDTRRERFVAKGVKFATDAQKLKNVVQAEGWEPIPAQIHISDIPGLVNKIGGRELYGDTSYVPIRELYQNARDAIKAKEALDIDFRGQVEICVGHDDSGYWFEIKDNGIGMTKQVLTNELLDFGNSYWLTYSSINDHPGLLSSKFKPAGKFGIGFFSVFMIANKVCIKTRSIHSSETYILEFGNGIYGRPNIEKAQGVNKKMQSGTTIRLYIECLDLVKLLVLTEHGTCLPDKLERKPEKFFSYHDICLQHLTALMVDIAPAADVDILCCYEGITHLAVKKDDWLSMDSKSFILRILNNRHTTKAYAYGVEKEKQLDLDKLSDYIEFIKNKDGEVIGRALVLCPYDNNFIDYSTSNMMLCVNQGLFVSTQQASNLDRVVPILGMIKAETEVATRYVSNVDRKIIDAWIKRQIEKMVVEKWFTNYRMCRLCMHLFSSTKINIVSFRSYLKKLPFGLSSKGWGTFDELIKILQLANEITFLDLKFWNEYEIDSLELDDGIIITSNFPLFTSSLINKAWNTDSRTITNIKYKKKKIGSDGASEEIWFKNVTTYVRFLDCNININELVSCINKGVADYNSANDECVELFAVKDIGLFHNNREIIMKGDGIINDVYEILLTLESIKSSNGYFVYRNVNIVEGENNLLCGKYNTSENKFDITSIDDEQDKMIAKLILDNVQQFLQK